MGVQVFDNHIASMDSKGRIKIPSGFMWEDNTEVAFLETGKSYFNVYPLVKIMEFIDILEEKKKKVSLEEYRQIRNLIRQTYYSILDTYTLDSQRRIIIPKSLRETIPNTKVLLQGINTHISVCPTPDSYEELCREYIPENCGIKKLW